MAVVFPFPIPAGSSAKPSLRVKKTDLGGGYVERAMEGINPLKHDFSIQYEGIDDATAEAIEDFLILYGAVGFFLTLPNKPTQLKYICTAWDRGYAGHNKNNLTLPLEQVTA